jgi:hypothetical protein
MLRKTLLLTVPLLLAGCQTWGPTWSEVSGYRYTKVDLNRLPAVIEQIDGSGAFASQPIKIEPGRHVLILQGPTPRRPGGALLQEYVLVAEPCKRYYINAQFENPVENKWWPVIDYVQDLAGCTVGPKVAAKE